MSKIMGGGGGGQDRGSIRNVHGFQFEVAGSCPTLTLTKPSSCLRYYVEECTERWAHVCDLVPA